MAWRIELTKEAKADIQKLDKPIKEQVDKFLYRLSQRDDPRSIGGALKGTFAGRWRYRVGNYRIVCELHDDVLVVLILEIGHRSKIYKK